MKGFKDLAKKSFAMVLSLNMVAQTLTQYTYTYASEVDEEPIEVISESNTEDVEDTYEETVEEETVEEEPITQEASLSVVDLTDDASLSVNPEVVDGTLKFTFVYNGETQIDANSSFTFNLPTDFTYDTVENESITVNGTIVGSYKIENGQLKVTLNEKYNDVKNQEASIQLDARVNSYVTQSEESKTFNLSNTRTMNYTLPAGMQVTKNEQTIDGYTTEIVLNPQNTVYMYAGDTVVIELPTTLSDGKTVIQYDDYDNGVMRTTNGVLLGTYTVKDNKVTITYTKDVAAGYIGYININGSYVKENLPKVATTIENDDVKDIEVPVIPVVISNYTFENVEYKNSQTNAGTVYWVDGNASEKPMAESEFGQANDFVVTGTFTSGDTTLQLTYKLSDSDITSTKSGSAYTYKINSGVLPSTGSYNGNSGTFTWNVKSVWDDEVTTVENSSDYVKTSYGNNTLYLVATKEPVYTVIVRAGDTEITDDQIEEYLDTFNLYTNIGGTLSKSDVSLDASYSITEDDKGNKTVTIQSSKLPAYTNEGRKINYFIEPSDKDMTGDWNVAELDGEILYADVINVNNFNHASYEYGVYENGT